MVTFIWRNAVQKGLFGGNKRWATLFVVIGAAKVMRRLAGSVPDTVYCEPLEPGQALVITHLADETHG
ncbi:MAG TPA: hypothetical protein VF230_11920 [Acidimicrobiales bacterium]